MLLRKALGYNSMDSLANAKYVAFNDIFAKIAR